MTIVDGEGDSFACCRHCRTELDSLHEDKEHLCYGRASQQFVEVDAPDLPAPATHEMTWKFTFEDVDEYHGETGRMYGYKAVAAQFDQALHNRVNRFDAVGDMGVH